MGEFITTNDGSWAFKFEKDPEDIKLPDTRPMWDMPYLGDPDRWANWSDPIIFECDWLIRQYIEMRMKDPGWGGLGKAAERRRRYTFGMMFRVLFGREYDPKRDSKYNVKLGRVMSHYSSRVQKNTSMPGMKNCKTVWFLSVTRFKKVAPYSLKVRLQWLADRGETPTWRNMAPPKDDLKPGHARNKKTEANMEARRERARKQFNERYNKVNNPKRDRKGKGKRQEA